MMLRADLLELDTPQGWHIFAPCHAPGAAVTVWRCVRCYGTVRKPKDWRDLGPGPCREFLPAIPRVTSEPHDPPAPPGQGSLWSLL